MAVYIYLKLKWVMGIFEALHSKNLQSPIVVLSCYHVLSCVCVCVYVCACVCVCVRVRDGTFDILTRRGLSF